MKVWQPIKDRILQPEISIFHAFHKPPYGGSNQFLLALRDELRDCGFRVGENHIAPRTKSCILNAFAFDSHLLRRKRRSGCRVLHRVDGPVGTYRGTDHTVDQQVADLNAEFADTTVFQSQYSYAANLALDLQFKSPVIISNAANPRIFNRLGRVPFGRDRKIRLISSSWSSNPNKGAASYRELESLLDWDKFEYTFVGRTEVQFDSIRTLDPVPSDGLADLLRQHDVYVTASLHDPCSNAVIEALTCGLPVIYVNSGGHAELVADAGYPFSHVTEIPDLLDRLVDEYETRQSRIQLPSLSDVANQYLDAMQIEH